MADGTLTAPTPAAPAPAAPPPAAAPSPGRMTTEDRAAALMEKYSAEDASPSEAAVAPEQPSPDGPGAAPAASGGEAAPDVAKATAERLARIAKVRSDLDAERTKRAREQAMRQQSQQQTSEVEGLRKRLAELEPMAQIPKSEEALLGWAEQNGMSVEKLVQYMRQRLTDPQAIAQRQVKTEADQLREEMKRQREEFESWKQAQEQREQERVAQYQAQQRAHSFLQRAHGSTETHPLTSHMLAKYGPEGLIAYANQFVAPLLRADYDVNELHDHVEQLLAETQLTAPAGPSQVQPATPPAKSGAGQPITTLGNKVASERATVPTEIPLHKMSLDERAEYLKAKYQREQ